MFQAKTYAFGRTIINVPFAFAAGRWSWSMLTLGYHVRRPIVWLIIIILFNDNDFCCSLSMLTTWLYIIIYDFAEVCVMTTLGLHYIAKGPSAVADMMWTESRVGEMKRKEKIFPSTNGGERVYIPRRPTSPLVSCMLTGAKSRGPFSQHESSFLPIKHCLWLSSL